MKTTRKAAVAALAVTCAVTCAAGFAACKDKPEETNVPESKVGMYFKPEGYADKVYAIRESDMSGKELTMVSSLQGILAQDKAAIFIEGSAGSTAETLSAASQKYGFAVEYVSDPYELVNKFSAVTGGKYVLYDDAGDTNVSDMNLSINYAAVVASVEHMVMVASSSENTAKAAGLTAGKDATALTTREVFDTYKDRLNKSFVVHQSPSNRYLRDYAIAGRAMCFYSDYYDGDANIRADILAWADENAPVLGWTENEINFVTANSSMSKVTVAADWAANLSFYAAAESGQLKQDNYEQREITPEKGKHYVAVVMSDGDNVQWMTRGFATDVKYYGSPYRGEFPVTWTTSPALYDLAPDVLSGLYKSATARDEFIAGPSGAGYVNITDYKADSLADYAAYTAGYMEKTDMQYVNLLDNGIDAERLDYISAQPQIKGGIWSVGNKYIEGEGAVYWSNGKPFLTARETLWRIAGNDNSNKYWGFTERVAQRINGYKRDYTAIEGYTVVLAHAWSIGSMDYISRFVSALDKDVELVTVGELLTLVSENVEHKDAYPDDISPDYFDGSLAPISSEQYDWRMVKDTEVTDKRDFVFDSKRNLGGWKFGTGGLEYDFAGWVSADSTGTPAIKLDGSDLEDVVDPLPNSWTYNMFQLAEGDNYLTLWINGGSNADVNMRVRALYEENGDVKAQVLKSDGYEKKLNEYGWYLRNAQSPAYFSYDISGLQGKKVLLSVEQDDSGDGSGEIVFITRALISAEKFTRPELSSWDVADIKQDWTCFGNVDNHTEGVCLHSETGAAAVYKQLEITEENKIFKFYVRMFVRADNPDTPPVLRLYADGEVVKAYGAEEDFISAQSDKYRCIVYDLSAYVGQTVTVRFESSAGQHAAIGKIISCNSFLPSELRTLYTIEALKTM